MKTPAFATTLTVSALALSSLVSAEANNNVDGVFKRADGQVLQRNLKIGVVPKDMLPLFRRADASEDTDAKDNGGDSTPTSTKATSSAKSSPSPTSKAKSSDKSTAKDQSSKEQGSLENDKEESASDNGNNKSKGNNKSDDGNDAVSGEVATDEEGNPIVTNQDASYWELIPPTGVVYPSGASSRQYSNGVALTAIGIVAAVMLF
ncbi:hypothetical protein FBU59_000906 [Linderina macrospora]|uniref:Uncharacterized protein n=1 Tax=Linderina macrospora TaxID=4868 RepID=A0ACC1JFD1_9FUNG|nr:hypothetical protein FBU59_000906 [Linderina macrospora]